MSRIFLFDTTHHALWAEQVAVARRLAAQVVPVPAGAEAKCDLALEVLPEDAAALAVVLEEEGIEFRLYQAR